MCEVWFTCLCLPHCRDVGSGGGGNTHFVLPLWLNEEVPWKCRAPKFMMFHSIVLPIVRLQKTRSTLEIGSLAKKIMREEKKLATKFLQPAEN